MGGKVETFFGEDSSLLSIDPGLQFVRVRFRGTLVAVTGYAMQLAARLAVFNVPLVTQTLNHPSFW
jgi:hypothetical protein